MPKANGRGLEPETDRIRGTNGTSVLPSLNASQIESRASLAKQLTVQGVSPLACRLAADRT